MPNIQRVTLPSTGDTLLIHEFPDVCDAITGRVLTGSWTWDSAFVLSDYISHRHADSSEFTLTGKTVLELGAGTGLPGLTAALLGALRVVSTDVASILPGLRRNAEVNGLSDRVEVRELVWGSGELPSGLTELDVVLLSDVFYDPDEMGALGRTLRSVSGGDTVVWAASEVRASTAECLNELASRGFEVSEVVSQTRPSRVDAFAVYRLVARSEGTTE